MKIIPKWLYIIDFVILFCVALCMIVDFCLTGMLSSDVLILCSSFVVFAFFLTSLWCVRALFHLQYNDDMIEKKWGRIAYGRIDYSGIEGVSIERAVGNAPYHIPFRDPNHKLKSVLTLFHIDKYISNEVLSDSYRTVYFSGRFNFLGSDFLNLDHLELLLNKTGALIYITEQMYMIYRDYLYEIICKHPNRFIIAYYDPVDKMEKKAPFSQFKGK
ncbi:MAG: hypothetical protein IJW40_08495 [Clostridia bacterium]|nr:hypothetical protein [Clostridia bacterium]